MAATMLGAPVQQVKATTFGQLDVVGAAAIASGMSFPCMSNGTIDMGKCPPPLGSPNNNVGIVLSGTPVGLIDNVNKEKCGGLLDPTCDEVGTWTISATGTISGWCHLATGTVSGSLVPLIALGGKSKARSFTATSEDAGGNWIIHGTTDKTSR